MLIMTSISQSVVVPTEFTGAEVVDGVLHLTLPAKSVVVLAVK